MNKIYTVFGVAVLILFGSTYMIFNNQVTSTKIQIEQEDEQSLRNFMSLKQSYLANFKKSYPSKTSLFNDYFKPANAKISRDTLICFFVYNSKMQKAGYDPKYYDCLIGKCESNIENSKVEEAVLSQLRKRKRVYGKKADLWFEKIGKDKFLNTTILAENCDTYFTSTSKLSINNVAFSEFDNFLQERNRAEKKLQRQSEKSLVDYRAQVRKAKNSLTSSGKRLLDRELQSSELTVEETTSLNFRGDVLGLINYAIPVTTYDINQFNTILDDIYLEQYKDNSLSTGTKPYAYCFGSNNSCSNGCSQISVQTPYNSDVLVTLKKGGSVYRHAYIRAGNSYTFKFPNGTYQAFFYYGKGWNPNKFMKNTSCGELNGGFLADEHFGKDVPQSLYNQILSYELILQQNGNFSTRPSNKDEAF